MLVPNNAHAYMASRQENQQVSKQASDHLSEVKQAGAKLMYNTTLGMVTARAQQIHMSQHAYESQTIAHSTTMLTG